MSRAALLAAVLAPLAPVTAVAASAPRPPVSVVEDEAQLLRGTPEARDRALDEWAALGAEVVRIIVPWDRAVTEPGMLDALDAVVDGAGRRGLGVLLDPTGPGPVPASRCRPRRAVCDPSPAAYGAWVEMLGRRYATVRRWSLWNEPNNPNWLQPQRTTSGAPRSPALYRALVRAGVGALRRSGHGDDLILAGETAPMPAARSRPAPIRPVAADVFLRRLLAAPGALGVSGIAHHPYTTDLRSPAGRSGAAQFTLAGLPALERLMASAARRGVLPRGAPLWLTEMGFQTDPPDPIFGVPLARQALWLAEAEREATVGGAAAVAQYLLVDEPRQSSFQSGLRFADGRAKPALAAYRLPLVVTRRGSRVTLWGRVRPVRAAGVRVEAQWRPAAGQAARTLVVTRTRARGALRLARRLAAGGAIRWRWHDDGAARTFFGAWVAVPRARAR